MPSTDYVSRLATRKRMVRTLQNDEKQEVHIGDAAKLLKDDVLWDERESRVL